MWYKTLLLLGVAFITSISANNYSPQQKKTRVLVVAFDRVDFYSQIEVPVILSSNGFFSSDEIHLAYKNKLIRTLDQSSSKFDFFELPDAEVKTLKTQAPVVHKMTPVSHFGVDLKKLRDSTLIMRFLENFNADYILFLCRYEINSKLFTSSRSFDGSTFVSWSRHEVDYELFNQNSELVAIASAFQLIPKRPTDTTYLTYGVQLDGMEEAYGELEKDIEQKVQRFKGDPIYRLKKR